MDCHVHWHTALDAYYDPDGFRLALNSLVQSLRNVTWVLQKQKSDLPGFDTWYPAWQKSVAEVPAMRWVIKARNRIVHEADLELHSRAFVRVEVDWLNTSESTYDVPPRWGPVEIAMMLDRKGATAIPTGEASISVQRRWVDRLLPEHELLDACATAYEHLRQVLLTAHSEAGVDECNMASRAPECVDADLRDPFDCNWFEGDLRTLHLDAATLEPYVSRQHRYEDLQLSDLSQVDTSNLPDVTFTGDAIDCVPQLFELGKLFLQADGALIPAIWLFRDDKIIDFRMLNYQDQVGKRLTMRQMASRVKLLNANGIMMLSEAWVAAVSKAEVRAAEGKLVPARDRPDRTEAIHAYAATADGRSRTIGAGFTRENEAFVFGPTSDTDEFAMIPFLHRIQEVWGTADPDPRATFLATLKGDDLDE